MSRLIRQIYSGIILEVVSETPSYLRIRRVDGDYPVMTLARQGYEARYEPYDGPRDAPREPRVAVALDAPPKRRRGRPRGSKNRPKL